MMNLPIRPRRNRKSANIRGLIRETSLSPEHLIYPVFVHEGTGNQPIPPLPGCTRWSVKGLVEEAKRLMDLGIRTLDLFQPFRMRKKRRTPAKPATLTASSRAPFTRSKAKCRASPS